MIWSNNWRSTEKSPTKTTDKYLQHVATMLLSCTMEVHPNYYDSQARKTPTETQSYSPISLLPTLSKVFERLILKRLEETVPINDIMPMHQLSFRTNHSTIQQCHRIVNKIKESMEGKKVCTSVFCCIPEDGSRDRSSELLLGSRRRKNGGWTPKNWYSRRGRIKEYLITKHRSTMKTELCWGGNRSAVEYTGRDWWILG
jgi:hypothetical protein